MEARIKAKIEAIGTPLKNWDVNIYRGILTGFNDAFIIDEATKNVLLEKSPKSVEIIRPILRGVDLKRYSQEFDNRWILFTRRSINMNLFPAVEKHLAKYYEQLKPKKQGDAIGRKPGTYKWYEIQDNVAYYPEFHKPKLIWGNLSVEPRFSLDEGQHYAVAPCNILTGDPILIKYLLAILNSALSYFFMRNQGYSREGGYIEYKKQFVEQMPIPKLANATQVELIDLVEKIIISKNEQISTKELERNIDDLIFDTLGLTKEEREYLHDYTTSN